VKPPPFDYVAPTTLEEALEALARHGDDAQPLAGGQSLVAMMALRVARPAVLVDINRIEALAGVAEEGAELRVGALTRQASILNDDVVRRRLPSLAAATKFIGHYQTRNRGTLGGSVSLADPAAEYPAFALAMDAVLELRSVQGRRDVAAKDFFQGPYMTDRRTDELLTGVRFAPKSGARIGVDEVQQRRGDFALSGLVARLDIDGDTIADAGLAWFGMGSRPTRAAKAEEGLRGAKLSEVDVGAVASDAVADTEPLDDSHASAAYRQAAGHVLAERLLSRLISGAPA
jgi:aerobic carbon-monoxide dehydrogenase medium subunit